MELQSIIDYKGYGLCNVELSIYCLSSLWWEETDFNNLGGSLWFCLYMFLITLHLSIPRL